jgi:hypothetical protein
VGLETASPEFAIREVEVEEELEVIERSWLEFAKQSALAKVFMKIKFSRGVCLGGS